MNLFWVIVVTVVTVLCGTSLCFWLLHEAREASITVWILEHIICPMIKIGVLLIVISQIYPVINPSTSGGDFWHILGQQGQFKTLLNILFFAGLLMAFLPLVNHPVFTLPTQSLLTIALVFKWQYVDVIDTVNLLPSVLTATEILIYMVIIYYVTRETSIRVSRRIDEKLAIEGSIRLVSDVIYLVLQIPVILIYCIYLRQQLPS